MTAINTLAGHLLLCVRRDSRSTGRELQMTSSRLLVCIFLTKLPETDFVRVARGPDVLQWDLSSRLSIVQLSWYLQENARIGESATDMLFSSQITTGSQCAHVTGVEESGDGHGEHHPA